MKKFIEFVKKNPIGILLYVVGMVLMFLDESVGAMVLASGPVATIADPGKPTAAPGQAGLSTQLNGEATTISNAQEASDIIKVDVDQQITMVASDENVIDTIKRRVKRQVPVTGYEVDHYLIDEKPSVITVAAEVTGGGARATIAFENNGGKHVAPYYTIIAKKTKGYEADGSTRSKKNLMLYCVDIDSTSGNPIFIAVNGTKSNPNDFYSNIPAIAKGEEFVLCSSAAYETQKFITPATVVPVPERMYLQKHLCNSIVSDYFDAKKKRVPFAQSQIAEAHIRQFRLDQCRTAWIGDAGKVKVKALDNSLGEQFAYTSLGLRWQFKREEELIPDEKGKLGFDSIIDLLMMKFTTYGSSKKAVWVLGKKLLGAIQKIDMTLHKDITMTSGTIFGIECTKLHTVFGDVSLVHDPTLDRIGYEWQGGIIDEEGLVRYYMKNESAEKEDVVGEEAERQIVMTIDCLCLKGYSHVWVDGSQLAPKA